MIQPHTRIRKVLFCLISSLSLTGAVASQPAQLPCASSKDGTQSICLRQPTVSTAPQTAADAAMASSVTSNLAVDQAMLSLTDDVKVLPKPTSTNVTINANLRQNQHTNNVAVKTKIKSKPAHAVVKAAPVKAAPIKPKLTRLQIVQQELNREKAALRAAENRLQAARKSGQNASSLERQVADRRASINAMQTELSRL